jgi:hypothetical protein
MSSSQEVWNWFGSDFVEVYLYHKEAELNYLKSMTSTECSLSRSLLMSFNDYVSSRLPRKMGKIISM